MFNDTSMQHIDLSHPTTRNHMSSTVNHNELSANFNSRKSSLPGIKKPGLLSQTGRNILGQGNFLAGRVDLKSEKKNLMRDIPKQEV